MHSMNLLEFAIADLTQATLTAPVTSKEAAYQAMAKLLYLKRELQPLDADGLAEIAVAHGLRVEDFAQAFIQWSQSDGR